MHKKRKWPISVNFIVLGDPLQPPAALETRQKIGPNILLIKTLKDGKTTVASSMS